MGDEAGELFLGEDRLAPTRVQPDDVEVSVTL